MFLAKLSINRPVMTTMGIIVFLLFGWLAFNSLQINQTPEVKIPWVTIQTIYPGAGPKEIETQISKKLEDAVATVSQIKKLESYSLDGVSIVVIEFELGKDVDVANQEVKDQVDVILNDLPGDAELPIIQKVDIQAFPIIDILLSGELDRRELYEFSDKVLKDRFSQIKGVAKVNITGGQEREIQVKMDNKVVFENMISLPQLIQILQSQNMDIPGGYFQLQDQEYTVRLEGEYSDLDAIENLEVQTPFGKKKLRQFAEVVDGGKNIRQRAVYYDNKINKRDDNVVRISLVKSSEGNAVSIAEDVAKALPEIKEIIPEGTQLDVVSDNSVFIRSTVDDTLSNIVLGIIFTSIILLIFLHDLRSTIIVALSMPTSIISSFLLFQWADMTINMMSLMGLSVSVGVLVSNSVVVLENIFRHKNLGKLKKQAAFIGTSEVAVAVVAATMTNIVVFLPLANISSIVGEFLKELALAAAFSTIFSLVISFTLTPMLASKILPNKQKEGWITRNINRWENMWNKLYERALSFVLKNKLISGLVVVLSFGLFIITTGYYGAQLGFEFMPVMDDGKIKVEVELPVGYNLEETAKVLAEIERRLGEYDEVSHMVTNLGKKNDLDIGTNLALMEVHLVDVKEREYGITDMISIFIKELSDIPNALIKVSQLEGIGGPGAPVEFFLMGQELEQLEKYKEVVIEKIEGTEGLINFDNSSRSGKPEISVIPKREKLSETGLTVMELALTLRSSIEGIESSIYREKGEEYDIIVTLQDEATNTPEKVGNIPIITQKGAFRLSQLADVEFTTGYTKVLRRDKFTSIQFTGAPAADEPLGDVIDRVDKKLETIDLPSGYRFQWGGSTEMFQQMIADLLFAFMLAIVLTYMLLAAILESFWQPILILLTLPLALIGVFLIMFYTGTTMSLTSMMGIIMLIGIVVNNAILILDYTNQLIREENMNAREALIKASPLKLKAIVMATLAIMLGLLPMALGIGDAGSEMRQPLGVVSIGGLTASAFLTLFVVPASFYLITSFISFIKRIFRKSASDNFAELDNI